MSESMNPEDKVFLQSLKEDIKEVRQENRISHEKTEKHLEKTCSEIKELSDGQNKMAIKVTRIDERLDNHLESTKDKASELESKKVSRREWIVIVIAIVGGLGTVIGMLK